MFCKQYKCYISAENDCYTVMSREQVTAHFVFTVNSSNICTVMMFYPQHKAYAKGRLFKILCTKIDNST
jgi:hypothetical protein